MSEKASAKGEQDEKKSSKVKRERRVEAPGKEDQQDRRTEEAIPPEATKPRRKRGETNESKSPGGNSNNDGGGWMSSNNNGNKPLKAKMNFEEDDGKDAVPTSSANKDKHFQDDNEEILLIPGLEDEPDSDQRIAHAPRNVNRRIPTLAELETEVKTALPNAEDGYNLNVLLSTLVPAAMVLETDTLWTFESLLREITDELTNTPKTVVSATVTAAPPTAPPTKVNNNHDAVKSKGAQQQQESSISPVNKTGSSTMFKPKGGVKQ